MESAGQIAQPQFDGYPRVGWPDQHQIPPLARVRRSNSSASLARCLISLTPCGKNAADIKESSSKSGDRHRVERGWIYIDGAERRFSCVANHGTLHKWIIGSLWTRDRIEAHTEAEVLRTAKHVTEHTQKAVASAFDSVVAVAKWTHESLEQVKSECVEEMAKLPALAAELAKAEQQSVIEGQAKEINALKAQVSALEQKDQKQQAAIEALVATDQKQQAAIEALIARVEKLEAKE